MKKSIYARDELLPIFEQAGPREASAELCRMARERARLLELAHPGLPEELLGRFLKTMKDVEDHNDWLLLPPLYLSRMPRDVAMHKEFERMRESHLIALLNILIEYRRNGDPTIQRYAA